MSPEPSQAQPPRPVRLAVLVLFLGFVLAGIALSAGTYHSISVFASEGGLREETEEGTFRDFPMFFAAADNVISNPGNLYDKETIVQSISRMYGMEREALSEYSAGVLRYYNPPFYLFMLAPLTLLDIQTAYVVTGLVNIAAALALAGVLAILLRGRAPLNFLVPAATLAYLPVHFAIFHGQPNILVALTIGCAFLAAERRRTLVASLLLVMASAKPQWIALPALAFLRHNPLALLPLAALGAAVILGPFLFLGGGVLVDYVRLVTDRAGVDLTQPRYSAELHNWIGFFRALTGSPQPAASIAASMLTLATAAVVFKRGDRDLIWAAAIFTTIVVTPHAHASEWVLALPAAAFLLRRQMSGRALAVTAILLLAVFTGTFGAIATDQSVAEGGRSVYWGVPAAFALVLWCAALPVLEERLPAIAQERIAQQMATS